MPDIIFWIKDKEGHFVHVNQQFAENVGQKSAIYLIGKTDFDFAPKHIAKQFTADDKRVMQGGAVSDRLELNLTPEGEMSWYTTSKRPIYADDGREIIGSYGITHRLEKVANTLSDIENLSAPIKYIKNNFHKDIKVHDLADIAHLSVSALERRFRKYLQKTPKQFINQVRLEHARRLLIESQLSISEISYQSGFSEPSYFAKQFKLQFDELPSETRAQHIQSQTDDDHVADAGRPTETPPSE